MQRPIEGEELDKTFSSCTVDLLCRISALRAVVSPGRTLQGRNHCEQPLVFHRACTCTWRLRQTSNDVTSSWFRGKLWLVHGRPRFRWSWPKIVSCTTPAGSPKRLLNPNFSPRTPVKRGSTPSSSKYCLVCGIILRNESFYALSRPELLCALNAILQTTVQFPLVKDDQRRVCKSCFRRLELIKNKSVLEALEKEFQGKYNSTVLKNRETTANIKRLAKDSPQDRRSKRICVISNLDANKPGINCTRTVLFASNCCKTQEDISCFPLEYEEEKENSFPGYTGSAPSENTCENKPDISKDEIKVRWFI